MRNIRLLPVAFVCLLLCSGCRTWSVVTAQGPATPEVQISGTALSSSRELDVAVWAIPNAGQSTDPAVRNSEDAASWKQNLLHAWTTNSYILVLAMHPIPLPKRTMGFSKSGSEILAPLGRETKVRAWIIPSLPADTEWCEDPNAALTRELDLRRLATRWDMRRYGKPWFHEPFPQTTAEFAVRLDQLAVPIDGTMEIHRTTEWSTHVELLGTAQDKPVQLTIHSRQVEKFDPKLAAQSVIMIPFLPILAISVASGGAAP